MLASAKFTLTLNENSLNLAMIAIVSMSKSEIGFAPGRRVLSVSGGRGTGELFVFVCFHKLDQVGQC